MWRPAARAVRKVDRMALWIGCSKSASAISTSGVPCTSPVEMRFIEMSSDAVRRRPARRRGRRRPPRRGRRPPRSSPCRRASRMSPATRSSVASVRPARCTVAPSRAKARATAPPIVAPAAVDHCVLAFQHQQCSLLVRPSSNGYPVTTTEAGRALIGHRPSWEPCAVAVGGLPSSVLEAAGLGSAVAEAVGRGERVWIVTRAKTQSLVLRRCADDSPGWLHAVLDGLAARFPVPRPLRVFSGRSHLVGGCRHLGGAVLPPW